MGSSSIATEPTFTTTAPDIDGFRAYRRHLRSARVPTALCNRGSPATAQGRNDCCFGKLRCTFRAKIFFTGSPGFHQPHNPSHASTPCQITDAKIPHRRPCAQSPSGPVVDVEGRDSHASPSPCDTAAPPFAGRAPSCCIAKLSRSQLIEPELVVEIGVNGMERRLPRLVQPAANASAVQEIMIQRKEIVA